MHSFIIAITTFTAYLLILTIDIVPYQLENHLLIVILSIESIVSIHSLQLYGTDTVSLWKFFFKEYIATYFFGILNLKKSICIISHQLQKDLKTHYVLMIMHYVLFTMTQLIIQ